jgi:hypothetical protein
LVTEYVLPVEVAHGLAVPAVITLGWAGIAPKVTAKVLGVPLPQALLGVTVQVPFVPDA